MKRFRERVTFSNVVACLALFVALGGASYAAIKLPKNSVGAKQLKKGAVTLAKLGKSTQAALHGAPGPKGDPGAPATALWAVVSKEGKLLHGTATSSLLIAAVGRYEVTFGQNVSSCAMVVTSQEEETEALAQPSSKNPDTVYVGMWTGGTGSEHQFSLAVFC